MSDSVFLKAEFFGLIFSALIVPVGIYLFLLKTRSITRGSVGWFGFFLICTAGISVYLLRRLRTMALATSTLFDDKIFASELTISLYLLPVLFAGVGVNLISHALIEHLKEAEASHKP